MPYSSTDPLPTLPRPTAPDPNPSDQITGLWLTGSITAVVDGCAAFTADDGRMFSLTGSALGTRTAGDRLRVRIVIVEEGRSCGPADAARVLEVKQTP